MDGRRLVNPRAAKSHGLMSMMATAAGGAAAADTGAAGRAFESNGNGGSSPARSSVNWPLWYVLPIAPYQKRKTLVTEVVPGKVSDGSVRRTSNKREKRGRLLAVSYLENDIMEGTPLSYISNM